MNYFWLGLFFHACITSLIQDLYGKEKYIAHVNAHWVDASITTPLALLGLMLVAVSLYRERKKKDNVIVVVEVRNGVE